MRRDDLDLWASPDEPLRDEALRALVDELPELEQLIVSRLFFGGECPTNAVVAAELGISIDALQRGKVRAFTRLRTKLLEADPTLG